MDTENRENVSTETDTNLDTLLQQWEATSAAVVCQPVQGTPSPSGSVQFRASDGSLFGNETECLRHEVLFVRRTVRRVVQKHIEDLRTLTHHVHAELDVVAENQTQLSKWAQVLETALDERNRELETLRTAHERRPLRRRPLRGPRVAQGTPTTTTPSLTVGDRG